MLFTHLFINVLLTGIENSFQPKAFCPSSDVIHMKIEASFLAAMKL